MMGRVDSRQKERMITERRDEKERRKKLGAE